MIVKSLLKPSEYHDSVRLMLVARELSKLEGIQDAAVVMATEANKSILADAGLLTPDAKEATPNDLLIAVSAESDPLADDALQKVEGLLRKKSSAEQTGEFRPKNIRGALSTQPEANVVVISVAGRYAVDEAWDALLSGLHVLLFSDNVSLQDEIALKKYANEQGLLLMGPGAGTAIINNVALGFANMVPSGPVGIVSAAGTGLQEVSTLLAHHGVGISQGIGTGGRDLKKEVGGIMMLDGLRALQQDSSTDVIVLISKPPADEVTKGILNQVAESNKPTVVCFLGGNLKSVTKISNLMPARTLSECALLAARIVHPEIGDVSNLLEEENTKLDEQARRFKTKLKPAQRYLRGLFSGGTLCYEAQVIWKAMGIHSVYSNAPLPGGEVLPDPTKSYKHSAMDLGGEEFTVGRPHPMIDNDLRIRRLQQEARDPEVGVILLDVVLGYGAHPDPASELGEAVEEACRIGRGEKRDFLVVASVTGTEDDPQDLHQSKSILEEAGVIVCRSNAAAARLTGLLVSG
jgi:succinyl-CoA synthetase alpha subunit